MKRSRVPAIFLLTVLLALPAAAEISKTTLGADGQLFSLHTGLYGDLFPAGTAADPADQVMALEIDSADGGTQLVLVPGTEGPEVERLPLLLYDENSQAVFMAWEKRINGIHPVLSLISYDAEGWSRPFEVIHNAFLPKSSPQIAVTRDSFLQEGADGELVSRNRTLLHLVWSEESTQGVYYTYYTAVILQDGAFLDNEKVFRLEDFEVEGDDGAGIPGLLLEPRLQPGEDGRSLVVGFLSGRTGRVVSIELDALPSELSRIADKARAHIIEVGARANLNNPQDVQRIAGDARAHIIEVGIAFHPEVARTIADQAQSFIVDFAASDPGAASGGEDELARVAGGARAHIIEVGAKFSDRGLRRTHRPSASEFVEIAGDPEAPKDDQPLPLLQFRVASSRPLPDGLVADGMQMFLSSTGDEATLAWPTEGALTYRESFGGTWSLERSLRLSDSLDMSEAYEILRDRTHGR